MGIPTYWLNQEIISNPCNSPKGYLFIYLSHWVMKFFIMYLLFYFARLQFLTNDGWMVNCMCKVNEIIDIIDV